MKYRLALLPLLLLAVLASNGSQAIACENQAPHGAGDCLRARANLGLPAPQSVSSAPQGVDISNWQGVPDFAGARRSGVRFVIIQTNDGGFENPFFWIQAGAAERAGIPWGTYTFLEGANPAGQAATALRMAAGHHRTLGVWADAEQSSAYPVTCSYVRYVQAHGVHIYGVYGSPGTYSGGRCPGYLWPAVWGAPARPLPGYSASGIIIHQWCGTCRVPWHSGEMDRDESLGLLTLAAPAPTPAQKHAALVRTRDELLADLHRHGCFHVHGRHAFKLCARWGRLWRHAEHQLHPHR